MFGCTSVEFFCLHHIRDVNRALALNNLAVRVLLAFAHVFFDHPHAFNNNSLFLGLERDHSSALAFVGPGDHHYLVVLFYMKTVHIGFAAT